MKQLEQIEIGRYRIQSHLTRGGMADIYLAHDRESSQTVAIKMVHESAGDYCERFQHEVKVMAALAHEHILPAFDYGEYESWYYLVTPYIEYGTLNGRLAAGPLTLDEVDPILAQLAAALQFAHEQGIVHRDVKPSNILMRDGNHVYLADFGLVKRVGQENGLTVTGYLIGTPEYMAPELAEEDATPQSDVYALGVLLYQMLAGRVPFTANTPMGIFLRHIRDIPKPPTTFNAAIPPEVEDVILRSIEKDPQARYQSAQELYLAYQQAVKNATARREVVMDLPTQISGNQLAGVVDIKIVKQKGRTRRPVLVAALLAICLLTGVLALVSSAFSSGGQGGNIHTADAKGVKNPGLSASKRVGPGSPIDSAVSTRPATRAGGAAGATVVNKVGPTTGLNQGPGSSPQNVKDVSEPASYGSNTGGGSNQDDDSIGGGGQGTTNDPGNGGAEQDTGSSGNGGGGQVLGSSGDGNASGQGPNSGGNHGDGGNGHSKGNGGENGHGNGKGKGNGGGKGNGHGKGH